MRMMLFSLGALFAIMTPSVISAQATARACGSVEEPGPACLLTRQHLPTLPRGKVYWHLDRFTSKQVAERASTATSAIVASFGSTWLFTLGSKTWRAKLGEHVATIGPLPVTPASSYAAEYLRSIFRPGARAPLHVHSGPEAFFAVTGDTCLETQSGVRIGRGSGNSLVIEAGPPMLLMAIGTVPRQGFALILHSADQPPTTLTDTWRPLGLCERQFLRDSDSQPKGN